MDSHTTIRTEIPKTTNPSSRPPNPNQERRSPAFKTSNEEGDRPQGLESSLDRGPGPSLTPYPSRPYSQLPTPQSPSNLGLYVSNASYTPDSPLANSSQNSYPYLALHPTTQRDPAQKRAREEVMAPSMSQQTATPESSPFARTNARFTGTATPRQIRPPPPQSPAPKSSMPTQETPPPSGLAPAHQISSPASSSTSSRTSQLSSPFMARLSMADQASKSRPSSRIHNERQVMQDDDVFSTPIKSNFKPSDPIQSSYISSPPKSPPRPMAGGEMERIRQAMIQDRLAQYQDAESRRPDYLKREKRMLSEADSTLVDDDREPLVGIMESPVKGRRLTLFQETSDESFEESLMAGGYGRYRTADWVRQPQPIFLADSGAPGPSNVVSTLEQTQEPQPPTEKELRKRKRLAAFTERMNGDGVMKLHPVELEGRGRVLLDIPPDVDDHSMVEGSPVKRKSAARRRKKGELSARDKKAQALEAAALGDLPDKPNWPDAEFPWRLRTQEREEEIKAQEEENLRVIERFLDRDSDDSEEEDVVRPLQVEGTSGMRGRGKLSSASGVRRRSLVFPTDPADARAALMSKKSVRTLSYRQEKRRRQQDNESDDEVLCICKGRDDGRELVQCDTCQTWYHLKCIGIRDISELGREEDPWFCRRCEETYSSPSPEPTSEPTFAPTDDRPRISPSYDAPFFQPSVQDSPMIWDPPRMPRTPTRARDTEYEPGISSRSPWVDPSRQRPMTPQQLDTAHRVYTHTATPGPYDSFGNLYDEPFDPTSTPSRGIKFGAAPFATPKNNGWSTRANGLFQTPLKSSSGRNTSGKAFGGLEMSMDGHGSSTGHDRTAHEDESPIRRTKPQEGPKARRIMESPLTARSMLPTPNQYLEESPIMRYGSFDRRPEFSHGSIP